MYKIGFTTVTFRKLTREQICRVAKENSIEYLEWGGDIHLPPCDDEALTEAVELQKKYGIKALSYGTYYRIGQQDYELFERILYVCEKIGCKRARLWLGTQSSSKTDRDVFDSMVCETQRLCDMADQKGITVSFEFHEGTYNDCAESSLEFLSAVNRKNLATYWQPLRTKEDLNNAKQVAPYVNGVHVFKWGKLNVRHGLSKGAEEWKQYIEFIKCGGNTDYILEFVKGDSLSQFKKDAEVLRQILKEVYGK